MDVKLKCEQCGKEFYRRKAEVNRSNRLGRKNFCSRNCQISYCNRNCRTKESFIKCGKHLPKGKSVDKYSPFRLHLKGIKMRAHKHKADITLQDLKNQWEKQDGICPYTGWVMVNRKSTMDKQPKTPNRASLDRIDSSKGYTVDNIQFICLMAQFAKNGWDEKELINFCQAVSTYQETNNAS